MNEGVTLAGLAVDAKGATHPVPHLPLAQISLFGKNLDRHLAPGHPRPFIAGEGKSSRLCMSRAGTGSVANTRTRAPRRESSSAEAIPSRSKRRWAALHQCTAIDRFLPHATATLGDRPAYRRTPSRPHAHSVSPHSLGAVEGERYLPPQVLRDGLLGHG